jgi:hypothetical protein
MKNEKLIFETNVLIALFKATLEQSTFLTDKLNQKPKYRFKIWQQAGMQMLQELEKVNLKNEDYLTSLTDIYHNITHEIRKQNKL